MTDEQGNRGGAGGSDPNSDLRRRLTRDLGGAAALPEAARLVEAVVDASPDPIIGTDDRGRVTSWNRAAEAMFQRTAAEMVGRRVGDAVVADDRGRLQELLDRCRVGDATNEVAVFCRASDGATLEVLVSCAPILDPSGELVGMAKILRDVGGLRETERALHARTRDLGERVKELQCLYAVSTILYERVDDLEGAFARVAEALPQGWKYPEITSARVTVAGEEYTSSGFAESAWRQATPVRVHDVEIGSVEVFYREERPAADAGPFLKEEARLLRAVAQRISEALLRRSAEEARQRNEAYFRALIENATDLVTIFDRHARVQYISPSVVRVLGYEPEELLGTDGFDIMHPDDVARVREVFQRWVDDTAFVPNEVYRIRTKDGRWRTMHASGTNLLGDPAVHGIVVHGRDVTEREAVESERAKLEEQLRQSQKMEAVGKLAGGVAHDFNNLLTVIKGHTEFLLADLEASDPRHGDVVEINKASRRAASLTRQLLAFSRRQVLKPRVIDLNETVQDLDKMLRRLIGEDIELVIRPAPEPVRAKVDPGQMEQVLMNLVVNARDAMPDGGRLYVVVESVEVESDPEGEGPPAGTYARLVVCDTGRGISAADRERIFEPFYTTKRRGTGLGLSTVYGIIKQSEGYIAVDSEEGRGTDFTIHFPLAAEPEPVAENLGMAPAQQMQNATILVVEDESSVRDLATRILRRAGYEVLEAGTGEEALQVAADYEGPIDLLFTDVVMPGMSGRELADQLVAGRPRTIVLFTSGYTDEAIVKHGILEGGIEFMEKPYTPIALRERVREILRKN